MANDYKILGQSTPSATTLTTLYTVPSATQAIISALTVCNRSATPQTFRLAFRPAGASIDNAHYVAYDSPIAGNDTLTPVIGATVDATDVVSVYASAATVTFTAFGQEIT